MTRRRGVGGGIVGRGVRGLALAGMLALCGALTEVPAQAFEPPPGSKNFATPSSVPNYFSNEAAPLGRASQTAQPGADRFNTARAPIAPSPAAAAASAGRATYRSRLTRGRAGRGAYAASHSGRSHAWTRRGSSATARAQAKASRHSVAAAQRTTAKNRPRYAARSSGHAGRSYR